MNFGCCKPIVWLGAAVLLPACDGILEGIYDRPVAVDEYGFVSVDRESGSGRIRVDASSYTDWVYIDFHRLTVETSAIDKDDPTAGVPASWDIAVHRYDVKTNGGSALETEYADFGALQAAGLPAEGYVADEPLTQNRISYDMSHMMDGYLIYAVSDYNAEVSKWLDVDTSEMPPVYTLSHRIYVVRLADGTHVALQLADFMDASGTKGVLTVDYRYPFES